MDAGFSSYSDDFYVNMDLFTTMAMPHQRETILQFYEAAQRQFPDLSDFYQRDSGEYVLEGDRQGGSYRWTELGSRQLSSGMFNPPAPQTAYEQHAWILDRSRTFLGMSHLDVESLDLVFGFNLDYVGNRDEIVCQALLGGSRLASVVSETNAPVLGLEPSLIIGLDEECSIQARLAVETRNTSYQVRTGDYEEEPISVYFTVRAYPRPGAKFNLTESLDRQIALGEEMLNRVVIPNIVQPIASAIAAR